MLAVMQQPYILLPAERTPPPAAEPSACDWQELLQDDQCLHTSAASAQKLSLQAGGPLNGRAQQYAVVAYDITLSVAFGNHTRLAGSMQVNLACT